jgi:uncharacterized protein YbjQ (UPF0145 family)
MKTCPNCNEILGDSVNDCFNCRYSFVYKRVITQEEARNKRIEEEKRLADKAASENEEIKFKLMIQKSQTNLKNMRHLTTGNNFDGYKISTYLGIISGESVLGTGFLSEFKANLSDTFGVASYAFSDKLRHAKETAVISLIDSCLEKGGNAIIGISFDYITFTNNLIGVIANGTAVVIERE